MRWQFRQPRKAGSYTFSIDDRLLTVEVDEHGFFTTPDDAIEEGIPIMWMAEQIDPPLHPNRRRR